MDTVTRWWFAPVALGRVAALRVLAYLFIPVDVLVTTSWVGDQAGTSGLYRPLVLAGVLRLPTPTPALVAVLRVALLTAALLAAAAAVQSGARWLRAAGVATAALYAWWMFVAMSYGKVDHDRFAFLVLLAVLPTVGAARLGQRTTSAAAGWAVRTAQVAVVATYFLAAWAKVRIGGWGWVNGGTLAWAIVRRPTALGGWMLQVPGLLRILQWATLFLELASPLLLMVRSSRVRVGVVGVVYAFHLLTFGTLGIIFLPHLVALAAFLPLERLRPGGLLVAATGYSEPMTEHHPDVDDDLVARRAKLLPEERAAGSDDPEAQARAILEDSELRKSDPDAAPGTFVEHRRSEETVEPAS